MKLSIALLTSIISIVKCNPVFDMNINTPKMNIESNLGHYDVFSPVPSCLSDVILVVYIQSLDIMENLEIYKDMYGPYFKDIEFYVDGTWCDPRHTRNMAEPCYGNLDKSKVPEEVNIVDRTGGGWMVQKSLIHAIETSRDDDDHVGFLFIADDVLLNLGQLTRGVLDAGCDVFWRSEIHICEDVINSELKTQVFRHFKSKIIDFFEKSDEIFREQLEKNLGTSSTYCMGNQMDFFYVPKRFSSRWVKVAMEMTESGLVFVFPFYSAIFGIAGMEDMVILNSKYLESNERSPEILKNSIFENGCWKGIDSDKKKVNSLLSSHIIHPNKISNPVAWDFAITLNSPGTDYYGEISPFWCD